MKKIFIFSVLFCLAASLFALPNLIGKKQFSNASVRNLDFSLSSEVFEIKETQDSIITIEVYCNYKKYAPSISLEDSTIKVVSRAKGFFAGVRSGVIMYIPQGMNFNDIYIETTSGEIKIDSELKAHTIKISSTSGDIEAERGLFADTVSVRATSGELELENIDADDLTVETTSGDINLKKYTGGTGSVRTSSGDIEIDDFAVEYGKFKSTSGDITVEDLECDYFDFESTSGTLCTNLINPPIAKSRMTATSGNIDITIPEGSSFEVEVHSNSGVFKDGFSNNRFVPRTPFHECINDGGALLELSTGSGNIVLDD